MKALRNFRSFSTLRGEKRTPLNLPIGEEVSGFRLDTVKEFPDFDIRLFSLTHNVTKTKYYHFDSNDMNNLFSFMFRTIPSDNKGKAHILEHLVLCGSEKYPVRDPFMKMIKRSLNTFMNAMTGFDMTLFPFSTQNKKDFENLLSVYADAVMKPRIRSMDFMQEAWRYEFEEKTNPESALKYQGVVFNEMKGYYENSEIIFEEISHRLMFKDTSYAMNSYGIPSEIPKLGYEELKQYYGDFYHPSNMALLSYGDLDFREHLNFLQENYLKYYDYLPLKTSISKSSISSPIRAVEIGPLPAAEINEGSSSKFGISFLCNDIRDNDYITSVGLEILSFMMFDSPTSPFYIEFLEGGHASNFCPGIGYDTSTQEATFTIGLSSITPKKGLSSSKRVEEIEKKIMQMLEELHEKGFEEDLLEVALHQIELEPLVPKRNFGMSLVHMAASPILFNSMGVLEGYLNIRKTIEEIRQKAKQGFFQELIGKYLLNNQKRVYLTLNPSKEFLKNLKEKEEESLKEALAKMTAEEKKEIVEKSKKLNEFQEAKDDIDVLPTLSVHDIPLELVRTNFQMTHVEGVPVYLSNLNTNSMTYLRIRVHTTNMPEFVHHYLKLFVNFFPKMGTEYKDHHQMADQWNLFTTSPDMKVISYAQIDSVEREENCVVFTVGCLDRNIDKMFDLLGELLSEVYFQDYKFLSSQLKMDSSEAANSFVSSAFRYAKEYAASTINPADQKYNSFKEARFLCQLGSTFSKTPHTKELMDDLVFHFTGTMNYLFKHKGILSFCFHTGAPNNEKILKRVEGLLKSQKFLAEPDIPKRDPEMMEGEKQFERSFLKTCFTLPMQTNYVCQAFQGPSFSDPDYPRLQVLSSLMNGTKLLEEVREKGGAYGAGSSISLNGVLSLHSYNDPHSLKTYDAFERAVKWAADGKFTQEDIDQAKMSMFSQEDQIVLPHERGLGQFIFGLSDDQRQLNRTRALEAKKEDLVAVANSYLLQQIREGRSTKAIFGQSEMNLEEIKADGFSVEVPVEGLSAKENNEWKEDVYEDDSE